MTNDRINHYVAEDIGFGDNASSPRNVEVEEIFAGVLRNDTSMLSADVTHEANVSLKIL